MNAEEFMRDHAMKASSGRIAEVLGDLMPEAITQLPVVAAGAPNPATGYDVKTVSEQNGVSVFDVTYTGEGGAALTMRETVQEIGGKWRIAKLEKPA